MKHRLFNSIKISTLALALTLSAALSFTPSKSNAVIGALTGEISEIVIGAILYGYGYLNYNNSSMGAPVWLNWVDTYVGFVLLDDNGQVNPKFTALSPEAGQSLNLSAAELASYNSELTQINLVYQNVVQETQSLSTTQKDKKALADFAAARWTLYSQNLTPETASVFNKMKALSPR